MWTRIKHGTNRMNKYIDKEYWVKNKSQDLQQKQRIIPQESRAKTHGDREQDKEILKTNKKEYSSGKRETKKDNSKPKQTQNIK